MNTEAGTELQVAAIILAAGAGTRMGRLKQLLVCRGKTLVQHSIDQAAAAGFDPVVVVVGSESHILRDSIAGQRIQIVQNERWQTGMGSSLAEGMRALFKSGKTPDAVAILVVDQPLIEPKHLAGMRELLARGEGAIVAARYSGTLGVPALFKREFFPALLSLPPEAGARTLLRSADSRVVEFPLPEAAVDIDTPEDFERFTSGARAESRRRT